MSQADLLHIIDDLHHYRRELLASDTILAATVSRVFATLIDIKSVPYSPNFGLTNEYMELGKAHFDTLFVGLSTAFRLGNVANTIL
ncbi:MAG: hypothetical protein WD396_06115 [Pseudohongiellaceae bacterium]